MRFYCVVLLVAATLLSTSGAVSTKFEKANVPKMISDHTDGVQAARFLRTVDDEERGALAKLKETLLKVKAEINYKLARTPEAKENAKFRKSLGRGITPTHLEELGLSSTKYRMYYGKYAKNVDAGINFHVTPKDI